ncbi:hypothetical protein IM816_05745 [Luteibacter flocculans]|uniref:Transcriptional regulator n=1 Tax=Luteibacter flocculans TaxID=2780091 RepID=A0ABY4T5U5_9GAMM|nr:hypothetical protein [Luteibacter flocculans]URL59599.1 hypothetical protein IM816_05745 [Luteibacter flocculans]
MQDRVIDEIIGLARHFHRLINPSTTNTEQSMLIISLSGQVLQAIVGVFQPSDEQREILRDRIDAVCREVVAEHQAEAQRASVH